MNRDDPDGVTMHNACDCHVHLYQSDARWTATRPAIQRADLESLRGLHASMGVSHVVVVQPSLYGSDNAWTLEMVRQLGPHRSRAIAIASADVTDTELDALRQAGVVGLRFFAGSALKHVGDAGSALAAMRSLAPRLRDRGMHLQVNTNGRFLAREGDAFEGLPCPLVFDHLAHVLPQPDGSYTGFPALQRLLDKGQVWVKVSGLYLDSLRRGDCEDMRGAAQALLSDYPERVVWGSNWPHPTVYAGEQIPDDGALMRRLVSWCPDPGVRRRLMWGNAAQLYGFTRSE